MASGVGRRLSNTLAGLARARCRIGATARGVGLTGRGLSLIAFSCGRNGTDVISILSTRLS